MRIRLTQVKPLEGWRGIALLCSAMGISGTE